MATYKFEPITEDSGGSVELDTELTQAGKAADAKAVGDRLDVLEDRPLVIIDSSLSQPNYAADAKAVGDKFNNYATKTYVDSAVANSGGGGGASIGTYSANLAYTLKDNGEYEVSGIGTCTDTHIVIPSIINSVKVTSIGDEAFSDCLNIVGVTIPNSVTVIGAKAFLACEKLESVEIPDSVTTIGQQAFSYCSKLASVTIPKSVTTIAKHAFLYSYQNNLTIYCEVESQPSGWDAAWNFDNFPVVWGAALDFASVNGKLASGGGGASGGGIIDVTELPTVGNEGVQYRVPASAAEYYNGYEQRKIKVHIVNGLPATGEPATTNMQGFENTYYNAADGVEYGYIPDTIASVAGVAAGWYPMSALYGMADASYGGVVGSLNAMTEKNTAYLLLEYNHYYYKNGWYCTTRETIRVLRTADDNQVHQLSDEDWQKLASNYQNIDIKFWMASDHSATVNWLRCSQVNGSEITFATTNNHILTDSTGTRLNVSWVKLVFDISQKTFKYKEYNYDVASPSVNEQEVT